MAQADDADEETVAVLRIVEEQKRAQAAVSSARASRAGSITNQAIPTIGGSARSDRALQASSRSARLQNTAPPPCSSRTSARQAQSSARSAPITGCSMVRRRAVRLCKSIAKKFKRVGVAYRRLRVRGLQSLSKRQRTRLCRWLLYIMYALGVASGAVYIGFAEDWSFVQTLYFTIVTVTTVSDTNDSPLILPSSLVHMDSIRPYSSPRLFQYNS